MKGVCTQTEMNCQRLYFNIRGIVLQSIDMASNVGWELY